MVAALDRVGMVDFIDRPPHHLSFGQRRRVAVATVLAMEPEILVLDEPSSNLDPASRRELADIIRSLDVTVLMVTHDLPYAYELCPRSVVLSDGVVVADGSTREVLTDDALMTAHRLELPFGFDPRTHPHALAAPRSTTRPRRPRTGARPRRTRVGPSSETEGGTRLHDVPVCRVGSPPSTGDRSATGRRTVEGIRLQQPVRGPREVRRHPPGPAVVRAMAQCREDSRGEQVAGRVVERLRRQGSGRPPVARTRSSRSRWRPARCCRTHGAHPTGRSGSRR